MLVAGLNGISRARILCRSTKSPSEESWGLWAQGDRKGALEAIPESVVDELIISGSVDECRAHLDRFFDNGVTTAALSIMPFPGVDVHAAIEGLAPAS